MEAHEEGSNPLDIINAEDDTHHVGVLHSIDRRGSSAKPWWIVASPVEDGVESNSLDADDDGEGLSLMQNVEGQLSVQNVLTFAKKRAMALSMLLITKAPILSAWCIVALIGGLYSFDEDDGDQFSWFDNNSK